MLKQALLIAICIALTGCGASREERFDNFSHQLASKSCHELYNEKAYAEQYKQALRANQDDEVTPFDVLATVGSLGSSAVVNMNQEETRNTQIQEQDNKILLVNQHIRHKGCAQ